VITGVVVPVATEDDRSVPVVPKVSAATLVTVPTLIEPPRLVLVPLIVIALLVSWLLAIEPNVPPRVNEPEEVTVPVKVMPLTLPVPLTEVTVPVVGVDHCGAVAPEFTVNTCPAVPIANLVPAPLVPPYKVSPAVVKGLKNTCDS